MIATSNRKNYTLSDLMAGIEDIQFQGDASCVIEGVDTIQNAKPGYITFLVNPLYKKHLSETKASAIILNAEDAKEVSDKSFNLIIARNPYFIYSKIAAFFDPKPQPKKGIHPTAVIGSNCKIDPTASVAELCVIKDGVKIAAGAIIGAGTFIGEDSIIGANSQIEPHVTIKHDTVIGERVVILSQTVIGSDGFGNAQHKGRWHKVPQLGRVIIEDDVEIGANCAIDRGAIGDTVIEKGARLDNLIQVGHNVRIGENTAIAGCVGIAGSATIGKNCLIGGGTGVNGHITIADQVIITGMTAVTKSIREPGIYSSGVGGLVTNLEWKKSSARFHRLENLMERVKELEITIQELLTERKST